MLRKLLIVLVVCTGSLILIPRLSNVAFGVPDDGRANGVWTGSLDFGGTSRAFTFQLQERGDRRLVGYVLGGTISRTVVDGSRTGPNVTFTVELRDPVRTKLLSISGRLHGDTLVGTADDGAISQPVILRRAGGVLQERRFFVAEADSTGQLVSIVQLAVVLDSSGGFVSGGFVGQNGCRTWACSGGLTSFVESGPNLTIGLETDGGCSAGAGSSVHAVFDAAAKTYSGNYTFTDCGGTKVGSVLMARSTRTRSDDVAQVLEALGQLADGFEARTDFGDSHPSFSTGYLHYGLTLRDTLAGYNEERHRFSSIEAAFNRIQLINTVDDPDAFPIIRQPFGAYFDEVRQGRPSRGAAPVTYVDSNANPGDRTMRAWSREGSRWVIRGNQAATFHLPFEYTAGATALITPTPGGPVYVSLGPYGAHFNPLTGHTGGDPKGNLVGFYSSSNADLTELDGDMDGICETGELCGFLGGVDGARIRDHVPTYIAPLPGKITSVTYRAPNGVYFDNAPKWIVEMELYTGQYLGLDHVGRIAPGLRAKILGATTGVVDTDTYVGPEGELPGVAGIPVLAGEALAFPQILATPIPGHPGYFRGGGGWVDRPWAEMEFNLGESLPGTIDRVCIYDHLPPAVRGMLQSILDADAADPTSQRFIGNPMRWQWTAETRLCRTYSTLPKDFSSLTGNFGGWSSFDGTEMVAFVEIEKDTASYDASLYTSPDVAMLIARVRPIGSTVPFRFVVPGVLAVDAHYPAGEILELTDSSLLIKWRTVNTPDDITLYERALYIRDENGLKVRWGQFALTQAGAVPPPGPPGGLTADMQCGTLNVVCYDRTDRPGF